MLIKGFKEKTKWIPAFAGMTVAVMLSFRAETRNPLNGRTPVFVTPAMLKFFKRTSLAFFTILFFMCAADLSHLPAGESNAEEASLKKRAVQVIRNFGSPYVNVAVQLSPARLPDKMDYALDEPLGIGLGLQLDDFKHSYCSAIPHGARLENPAAGDVRFSNIIENVRRADVYLPYSRLRNSVRGAATDFRSSSAGRYYSYSTKIEGYATVDAGASLAPQSAEYTGARNSKFESVFEITFAYHGAAGWRLYDIHRTDFNAHGDRTFIIENMKASPYYENCSRP